MPAQRVYSEGPAAASEAAHEGVVGLPVRLLTSTRAIVIGVTLLAVVLRVLFLGSKSLWIDEALSVATARLDWPDFWRLVSTRNANMVLYMVLLRLWLFLGGTEVVIRSLSVVFAVATIPVLYRLGATLLGRPAGLMAAGLLAINTFHLRHAQEARSYALLVLLVTVSTLYFVKAIREPSPRHWVAYGVASALAVYSHLFGALVPAAHWVSLLFIRPRAVPWKGLIASTLATGALMAPMALFLLARSDWGLDWYTVRPGAASVARVLYVLAGGALPLVTYFLAALVGAVAAVKLWRTSWGAPQAWGHGLLFCWLVVPMAIAFVASYRSPMFISRYLIVVLPALVLLVASGLARLRGRAVLAVALAMVVVAAGQAVGSYYAQPGEEDWRGATRHVLSQARSTDAVMIYAANELAGFEYYRARYAGPDRGPTVVFPPGSEGMGIWEAGSMGERQPERPLLEDVATRYDRVWLILSHDQLTELGRDAVSRSLREYLGSRYPSVEERRFTGIRVALYRREP